MATFLKRPSGKVTQQPYAKYEEAQSIPTLPNRLRAFVLDRATGKPIAKVVVAAIAELEKVQNPGEKREVTIGLLASDHAGYLSFDLSNLPPIESQPDDNNPRQEITRNVWIAPFYAPDTRVEVLPKIKDLPDPIITMPIDQPPSATQSGNPNLPSIQGCADAMDWKVSPYSVATEDMLIVGEPGCEDLLLSKAVERAFRFSQLVREPNPSPEEAEVAVLSRCETALSVPPLCYRIGALLEYEMTWQPVGHGLGRVLYSLPLAPCESVKLAIIDWAREDKSIRGEVTGVNENLLHNQYRERDIDETVRASIREWQRGGSVMGGLGGVVEGVVGALGGSYSTSSGTRNVAADTTQELADKILQASSLTRRLNSTVIVQASQTERERIETRTVTNHNHCHSLTVLYYEVVRHYCVMTRLAKKQDVILIKYPDISFDESTVLRYRLILERVLLDQNLSSCFDIVQRLFCARLDFDPSTVVLAPDDFEMTSFRIRTTTGARGFSGYPESGIEVSIITKGDSPETIRCFADPGYNRAGGSPSQQWHLGILSGGSPFESQGQEGFFTITPVQPIRWGNVDKIKLVQNRGWEWELAHLHAFTTHEDQEWIMYNGDVGETLTGTNPLEIVVVPYGGPRSPEDTLTHADRCCVARLLKHLNDNLTYYNRAIWLTEDADERARRFDMYQFAIGSVRGRLIDFIENRPVGVSGDYVAFLIGHDMQFASNIDNAYAERIISMPTRGAFAEAKLSHCNACEKRDPTRFWKWQESPCPETPPDITGITPGSRARDIIEAPTTLPAPGVSVEDPQEAPAPVGMDKVLELLGKEEIFRDMSGRGELGTLLGQLAAGAVDLEKTKIENATELETARIAARTGQRTGQGAPAEEGTGTPTGGTTPPPSGGRASGGQATTGPSGVGQEGTPEYQADQIRLARNAIEEYRNSTGADTSDLERRLAENTVVATERPRQWQVPRFDLRLPYEVDSEYIEFDIRDIFVPEVADATAAGFSIGVAPVSLGLSGPISRPQQANFMVLGRIYISQRGLDDHPAIRMNAEVDAQWRHQYVFRIECSGSVEADIEAVSNIRARGTTDNGERVLFPNSLSNADCSVRTLEEGESRYLIIGFPLLGAGLQVKATLQGEIGFAGSGVLDLRGGGRFQFMDALPTR